MTLLSFISAFCFSLSLITGSLALRENISSAQNRIFSFFCFVVAFISFAEFGYRQAESIKTACFWFQIGVITPLLTPIILHFIVHFTHTNNRRSYQTIIYITYIIAIVFICIDFFTGQISGKPAHSVWGWDHNQVSGVWYQLYTFWTIAVYLFAMQTIVRYYLSVDTLTEKLRSRYTMLSFLVVGILTLTTEKAFPYIDFEFPELSTFGYVIANVLIGYAMWKYKLFSISPISAAQKIVETMNDGLLLIDNKGIIVSANTAAEDMFFSGEKTLVRASINHLFFDQADYDKIITISNNLNESILDVSVLFKSKHSSSVPVSISTSILANKHGDKAGTILIARNITERLNAQRALQEANELLEQRVQERTNELAESNLALSRERDRLDVTLKSIGDGVIVTSTDCTIQLFNKKAEEIIGCTFEQVKGEKIQNIFRVIRSDTETTLDPVGDAIQKEMCIELEDNAMLVACDASLKRVEDSAAPIKDASGTIIGCVLVFRDSTEKHALQQELFKAKRLESVSSLAGGIARDFEKILNTITNNMLMIKLLAHQTPDTVTLINDTERIALDAQKLTKRLMVFSGASEQPELQVESVRELIQNSIGFIIKDKSIDYNLLFDDNLMNISIDRNSFNTIMSNLVANAEEAVSDNGIISIESRNVYIWSNDHEIFRKVNNHELHYGNYVKITIRDNGHGISDTIKEQAFDPFFSTRGTHRGLGLSVVYSIIKRLGGIVYFEPEIAQGCAVSFLLPSTDRSTQNQLSISVKDLFNDDSCLPQCSLLIIGSDNAIRASITDVLLGAGFDVTDTADPASACELFNAALKRNNPFEFVIVDMNREIDRNLFDAIAKCKEITPSVKTVALIHPATQMSINDSMQSSVNFVITKPFNAMDIARIILKEAYC